MLPLYLNLHCKWHIRVQFDIKIIKPDVSPPQIRFNDDGSTEIGVTELRMEKLYVIIYQNWTRWEGKCICLTESRHSCVYNKTFIRLSSVYFCLTNQSFSCVNNFILQAVPTRRCPILPPPLPQHPGVLRHQQPQEQLKRPELLHHPPPCRDHLHPLPLPQACRCC